VSSPVTHCATSRQLTKNQKQHRALEAVRFLKICCSVDIANRIKDLRKTVRPMSAREKRAHNFRGLLTESNPHVTH
jgi:hypothetical protein